MLEWVLEQGDIKSSNDRSAPRPGGLAAYQRPILGPSAPESSLLGKLLSDAKYKQRKMNSRPPIVGQVFTIPLLTRDIVKLDYY